MSTLRLLGRDAAVFRRAVAEHSVSWPGGGVCANWLPLPELERVLSDPAGTGHDIVLVPADRLPALAAAGQIIGLDHLIATAPPADWPAGWPQAFLDGVRWNGHVYGLPFHDGPQLLYSRPALLARHGLAVPGTWSAFRAVAAALHEPGVRAGTVHAGFPDGHDNVYDLVLHLWRHGGELLTDSGEPYLEPEPVIAALDTLRSLADLGPAHARDLDSVAAGAEFASGQVGTTVAWAGFAGDAARGPAGDDLLLTVAPTHDDGTPTTTVAAFWALAITTSARDPDRAWDLLRHVASPAGDLATTRAGASGTRYSTWDAQEVRTTAPEYTLFAEAHATSRPLPRLARLPRLVTVLGELVDTVVWRGERCGPALDRARRACDRLDADDRSLLG